MSDYEIELYKILGEMLRNERTRKGYTLEQVAEFVGMTPKTIQRYEQGERKIKIGTIIKICSFLGIDSNELLASAKSNLSGEEQKKRFYIDDETAEVAQRIYENDKILFDVYKSSNKDELVRYAAYLQSMLSKEEGD